MSISRELAEIKEIFHDEIPLIFIIMDEKQILTGYWPIIKDALVEDKGIKDQRIREGLMVTLSSQCENSYCFVSHSYFLYNLGFTVESIETMVTELKFPDQIHEGDKWSLILKWAFLFGRPQTGPSDTSMDLNETIRKLITPDEYRHLFKICTIIDILNRFSEFYSDKIQIANEDMLHDPSEKLKLPIPDLVKYYTDISRSENSVKKPVVSICAYCKNIQDIKGNWLALESVLPSLDRNSTFSHGICSDCYEIIKNENA